MSQAIIKYSNARGMIAKTHTKVYRNAFRTEQQILTDFPTILSVVFKAIIQKRGHITPVNVRNLFNFFYFKDAPDSCRLVKPRHVTFRCVVRTCTCSVMS